MVKFLVSVVVILAILSLIGGAIEFQTTNNAWLLIADKEAVMNSVQNGVISVYDFVKGLITSTDVKT